MADYVADPRIDEILAALPEWHREICQRVRELAHAADPEIVETIKRTSMPFFVMSGNVCALMIAKRHVSVFLYDPTVADPAGIITDGHDNKTGRQITVNPGDALDDEALVEMLRAIAANNRAGGWRKLQGR